MSDVLTLGVIVLAIGLSAVAGLEYAILKELRYGNTLTVLAMQRRSGARRSGTILRLPHIDYGNKESLIDEA